MISFCCSVDANCLNIVLNRSFWIFLLILTSNYWKITLLLSMMQQSYSCLLTRKSRTVFHFSHAFPYRNTITCRVSNSHDAPANRLSSPVYNRIYAFLPLCQLWKCISFAASSLKLIFYCSLYCSGMYLTICMQIKKFFLKAVF